MPLAEEEAFVEDGESSDDDGTASTRWIATRCNGGPRTS